VRPRVVAVVTHPDDEVLGCGATLARFSDAGSVTQVVLAVRRTDPRGKVHWDELVDSFQRACRILGAEPVLPEHLLDEGGVEGRIQDLHDALVPRLEGADVVFTHWPGDVHQAHRAVSRAVEIATRPFRRHAAVQLFEVPTSTDQAFPVPPGAAFAPTCWSLVDRSHAERKVEAMGCYGTEEAPGRRPEDLLRRLELRGAEVAAPFAEAFVTARSYL
jgi:LmbE family N-acetylglucosaminyl deacetylase